MIELVTTDGIFALDGGEWEVTNNIWLVGDEREVLVVDAAHDAPAIAAAVNGRRVTGIVLTHGHNDHINAAAALQDLVDAPVLLHPADRMLWEVVYPDRTPDRDLAEGDTVTAAGINLGVLHTPGHSPGCCSFHAIAAGPDGQPVVFSGDTLFCGGPGATGRSFSDFPTIVESIRTRLLTLPPETIVHTGHGDSTTIGAEAPALDDWIGAVTDSLRSMHLDTLLLTSGPAVADDARQFAAAGIDGVFTFEGPGDPFVPLTLAASVSDLWISTSVALAFVRSPMSLAYTAWDLQRLSAGRFLLGLGTQVRANVEDRYGSDFTRPVVRMRETVEAIHAIFDRWQNGTALSYVGETTRHTLMQPLFDPGPLEWGPPPVLVGALGPQMTRMASRVADGVIVHPVMSPLYLADTTAPNIVAGLSRAGRSRGDLTVVCDVIVATGRDDREMEIALAGVRSLLSFYLSTPAYAAPLEPYGWEGLQPELNSLSKQGRWAEMVALVDDEILSTLAVVGDPSQVATSLQERFAALEPDRIGFYLPYAAPTDLVGDVVAAFRGG